jgi:hypothetical protein
MDLQKEETWDGRAKRVDAFFGRQPLALTDDSPRRTIPSAAEGTAYVTGGAQFGLCLTPSGPLSNAAAPFRGIIQPLHLLARTH